MEWLLPALFGFIGVFLGGVFSYWGIKKQVEHSDKRFEKELARAREESQQKRRWEIRSEPLLKLRAELAVMATKLEKLAKRGKTFSPIKTQEQEEEVLKQAVNDWNYYISEDHLEKVLYSQFDADILNRVREIRNDYLDIHSTVVTFKEGLSAVEFGEAARAAEEKIRPKVAEVQELINKKLEAL